LLEAASRAGNVRLTLENRFLLAVEIHYFHRYLSNPSLCSICLPTRGIGDRRRDLFRGGGLYRGLASEPFNVLAHPP